jgi:Asp-tRNA(Asn)/Glu-tRNA(Gln) amidotransferase A subunit family amidase
VPRPGRGERHERLRDRPRRAARERAREAAVAAEDGEYWGPLHGVPVAIKDLTFPKEGVRYTLGAAPLADNVADRTTVAVERLEDAGAIIVGTTNTPELGHTVRTFNELVGPTATPFDTDYNAGGSSGGSAAALAEGLVPLATGSDVGGSLRNPASCCGVVSVKPTFGLVPKDTRPNAFYSHTPFGVLGPMARTVDDLVLLLDVMVGRDDRDPYSVPAGSYGDVTPADASDLDVAYSPDLDDFAVAPSVRETTREAVDALVDAGATVAEVEVGGPPKPDLSHRYGQQAAVFFGTVADVVADEHGVDLYTAEDVSDTLTQTLGMARGHDALDVAGANRARTALYDAVESVLADHDLLAVPTLATPPLTHDEPLPTEIDGEPTGGLPMDWTLTCPFNLTGHPVVHVPAGTVDGLPVGLQLVGPRYGERDLLAAAALYEDVNPWSYPDA